MIGSDEGGREGGDEEGAIGEQIMRGTRVSGLVKRGVNRSVSPSVHPSVTNELKSS